MLPEETVYNTVLSTNARNLLNQYESAKWGIALTGPGNATGETGLTGAEAEAAMASTQAGATTDGYSVFTTGSLNRLSQSSNLILQASHNISLDLQGDTLALASGKNLTLTAGNQISNASAGTITTNGGNISLNATGAGTIALSNFGLNATGGGKVNLAAGGSVAVSSPTALNLGTVSGTSVSLQTTGASDITLANGGSITTSGPGNALVLASGRNFVNNANSSVFSLTGGGRYLVYSANPASNTMGGLSDVGKHLFNKTYAGYAPGSVTQTGNLFLYSLAPTLTATPSAQITLNAGDAVPSLSSYLYTLSGYLGSDAGSDAVTGSLNGTTPYTPSSAAGIYALNYSTGSLASALGYGFSYVNAPNAITANLFTLGGTSPTYPKPTPPIPAPPVIAQGGNNAPPPAAPNNPPPVVTAVSLPNTVLRVMSQPSILLASTEPLRVQDDYDNETLIDETSGTTGKVSQDPTALPRSAIDSIGKTPLENLTETGLLEISPEIKAEYHLCTGAGGGVYYCGGE